MADHGLRTGLNSLAGLFGLVGIGMAAGGDWIAGLSQAATVKIFGVLLTVLGGMVAIVTRLLLYNVSQAVETLSRMPAMEAKLESVDERTERIPSDEWFENVSNDIGMIRKGYRRMRRLYKAMGERLGWCEGQLGKHGVGPGAPLDARDTRQPPARRTGDV